MAIGGGIAALAALGAFTWKRPRLAGVLFWALIASILLSAAIDIVAPGDFADRVILTSLLLPLIWVGFQFWLYWSPSRWRIVAILIGLSILSAIVIIISPAPF
ncbi:MAG: hypothetical protein AAGD40_02265 [Pseudomonadota bacterium]